VVFADWFNDLGGGVVITGKRVLCAACPIIGHAIPTAALALEFQRAGNDVVMVTDQSALAEMYQKLDLRYIDIRGNHGLEAGSVVCPGLSRASLPGVDSPLRTLPWIREAIPDPSRPTPVHL